MGHCRTFFQAVLQQARERSLLSDEHFTWWNATGSVGECEKLSAQGCEEHRSAGRSWQCDSGLPRGEAVEPDHASKTDPDAKMAPQRQGQRSEASYNEICWWEPQRTDRNTEVFEATDAERDAAAGDAGTDSGHEASNVRRQGYDTADFSWGRVQNLKVTRTGQNLERPEWERPLMLVRRRQPDMPSVRGKGNA